MGRILTPLPFVERRQRQFAETPYRRPLQWTPAELLAMGQVGAQVASTLGTGLARAAHEAPEYQEPGAPATQPTASTRRQAALELAPKPQQAPVPGAAEPEPTLTDLGYMPEYEVGVGLDVAEPPTTFPEVGRVEMQPGPGGTLPGPDEAFVQAAARRAGLGPQEPEVQREPQSAPFGAERVALSPATQQALAGRTAPSVRHAAGPVSMSSLRQMAVEAAKTGRREDAAAVLETFRRYKDDLDVFPESPGDWLTGAHKTRAERELVDLFRQHKADKAKDFDELRALQIQEKRRELAAGVPESKAGKLAGQAEREQARGSEAADQEAARTTQMQAKAEVAREFQRAGLDRAKAQAVLAVLDAQNEPRKFAAEMSNLYARTGLTKVQAERARGIVDAHIDERNTAAKEEHNRVYAEFVGKWQPASVSVANQSEMRREEGLQRRMNEAEEAANKAEEALGSGDAGLQALADDLNWRSVGGAKLDLAAARKKTSDLLAASKRTAQQAHAALVKMRATPANLREDTAPAAKK